jgi:hypothetical protein
MIKKVAIGLVGLGVLGGAAWAGITQFGPQSQTPADAAAAEDEEDPEHFQVRRTGPVEIDSNGFPKLRNGLWNVTTVTDGVTMSAKICLDDAFQREVSLFALSLNGSLCPEAPTISRSGGGFTTNRTCAMGPVRLVDTTQISGDMQTNYVRQTNTVTTGPGIPPQTSSQRETGSFAGRCPSDMSGGDMDMNGGRMNARMLLAIGGAVALPSGALDQIDPTKMTPPRPARD